MTLGDRARGAARAAARARGVGAPVLGTCAGLILLDREHLGLLDVDGRRNAFGRQLACFEAELGWPAWAALTRGVFIRAPWVERDGSGGRGAGRGRRPPGGRPPGNILAVAFHPEIAGDTRLHRWLLAADARNGGRAGEGPARGGARTDPGALLDTVREGRRLRDPVHDHRGAAGAGGLRGGAAGRWSADHAAHHRGGQAAFFDLASDEQLDWVPPTAEWAAENADVRIVLMADANARELSQADPRSRRARRRPARG